MNQGKLLSIARMHSVIITALITLNLSGCVGFSLSTLETMEYTDNPMRARDHYTRIESGVVKTTTRNRWCGITLFIGLPLPLELPICETYQEITFKNNRRVAATDKYLKTHSYTCGPFNWIPWAMAYSWEGNFFCGGATTD